MKFLYIIVFLAVMYEVHAASKRMCGRVLSQALENICLDGFNTMPIKKSVPIRHDFDIMNMANGIEDGMSSYEKTSLLDDIFLGDHVNTVAKTRRRRNLFGIYEECCAKSCSYSELKTYCN